METKNWNDLEKLAFHELTEKDEKCLSEIQTILEKNGLTSKFGVALLHKHFDIAEDEVLLETNNPTTKTLTSKPMKVEELNGKDYATTIWRFDDGMRYGCHYCNKNHCD